MIKVSIPISDLPISNFLVHGNYNELMNVDSIECIKKKRFEKTWTNVQVFFMNISINTGFYFFSYPLSSLLQ